MGHQIADGKVFGCFVGVSTLLVLSATWLDWQQGPHPDAYRLSPSLFDSEFWLYPVEQNFFLRLPKIMEGLNDVFAQGRQVWAVGNKG